jgi:hypothetical protein
VRGECVTGIGDAVSGGVQVALGRRERSVAGDDAQDVHGDAGIGHPGQSGVAQGVAAEVLEAE